MTHDVLFCLLSFLSSLFSSLFSSLILILILAGMCSACPIGKTTNGVTGATSSTQCDTCAKGYTGANCDLCPANSYKSTKGASSCLPCPNGKITLSGIISDHVARCVCAAGEEIRPTAKIVQNEACTGDWRDVTEEECDQSLSPSRSFSGGGTQWVHGCFKSTNGSPYWNDANLGGIKGYRYCLRSSSSCDKCERGKFKILPTSDDMMCSDMSTSTCPQGRGYHTDTAPSSDGLGSTANDGRCESCPAGKYKPGINHNDCIQMTSTSTCPPGQGFSSASATAAGVTESSADDGTCTLCSIHQYKTSTGYVACDDMSTGRFCPMGEIFSSASATSGVIGSTQNDGTCDACPVNTWKGTTTTDASSNVCATCHDHSVTNGLDRRTSVNDCQCVQGYSGSMSFTTISATCGCETGSGVTRNGFWTGTTSTEDCVSKCQAEPGCVAVDRAGNGWCNWYKNICMNPSHGCGNNWGHFRLNAPACEGCPLNSYKPTISSGDCSSCPSGSSTATTASTKPEDCLCNKGHGGCVLSAFYLIINYFFSPLAKNFFARRKKTGGGTDFFFYFFIS